MPVEMALREIKQDLPGDYQDKITTIKSLSQLPVVAGFGISSRKLAASALKYADGFVVGSYFVKAINEGITPDGLTQLAYELYPKSEGIVMFLVGKDVKKSQTIISIKDQKIGGGDFTVMAGPCAIESRAQISSIAKIVSAKGATILRGGAFKPRTSPYEFQGLGELGLKYLRKAADDNNMLCISEVMSTDELALVESHVDILQIGARNMQNYNLLKAVGRSSKPVVLK